MASASIGSSGPIRFSTLKSIFGSSGPVRFSTFKRDNIYIPDIPANTNIPTTYTNMRLKKFYNATILRIITLSTGNTENLNLLTLAGTTYGAALNTAKKYIKLIIPSGAVVGSTNSANAALDITQFQSGSIIEIENNGIIQGAGGTAGSAGFTSIQSAGNGGNGGDAIKANYLNQTVTITNNGSMYGGGGGGGGGSKGANGVDGNSVVVSIGPVYTTNSYWIVSPVIGERAVWEGNGYSSPFPSNLIKGAFVETKSGPFGLSSYYRITNTSNTVSGGTGGEGGNGGNGGRGRGYNYSGVLTGISGTIGSAGAPSNGSGSGAGGTGGTGGGGGIGSEYGISGNNGGNGSGGKSGVAANIIDSNTFQVIQTLYWNQAIGNGGAAGKYLLKGSATVSFTNTGTVVGLLA